MEPMPEVNVMMKIAKRREQQLQKRLKARKDRKRHNKIAKKERRKNRQ